MKIFSRGNHKLPKNIAIFNIPELKTCPGKTSACSKLCYAIKASTMYHHVVPAQRKRNLRLSISDKFILEACKELKRYKKITAVRIHESGDFYNQTYLDKWIKISNNFPKLIFFAYTKSYMLDYSQLPENFIMIYSSDWTTKNYSIQLKNHAIMLDTRRKDCTTDIKWNNKSVLKCPGSCKSCDYCYTKPKETKLLYFPLH